ERLGGGDEQEAPRRGGERAHDAAEVLLELARTARQGGGVTIPVVISARCITRTASTIASGLPPASSSTRSRTRGSIGPGTRDSRSRVAASRPSAGTSRRGTSR